MSAMLLLLTGCADPALNAVVLNTGEGAAVGAMMGAALGGVGAGPGALAGAAMGLGLSVSAIIPTLGTPMSPLYPIPPVAMVPSYYPMFPYP